MMPRSDSPLAQAQESVFFFFATKQRRCHISNTVEAASFDRFSSSVQEKDHELGNKETERERERERKREREKKKKKTALVRLDGANSYWGCLLLQRLKRPASCNK